ncbi:MAG: (deoxy)nucleoside triphosphate pyrophosphohydrolase [Planctomycetota bacterium]
MQDASNRSQPRAGDGVARASSVEPPAIRVAVGVLGRRRGGDASGEAEVLIALRRAGGVLGGLWEFPGGKLEPGESAEAALRREMQEELGVRVRIVGRLTEVRHRYDHGAVRLEVFGCRQDDESGGREPAALAAERVRWVDAAGLAAAEFPAANGPIVAAATAWMQAGLEDLPHD